MRAWVVAKPGPICTGPLELTERPLPEPGPGQLLIKVIAKERNLRSVTSNTRGDAQEFLTLAQRLKINVTTTPYPFSQAGQALADLEAGRVDGAAVLPL